MPQNSSAINLFMLHPYVTNLYDDDLEPFILRPHSFHLSV